MEALQSAPATGDVFKKVLGRSELQDRNGQTETRFELHGRTWFVRDVQMERRARRFGCDSSRS